MARLVNDMLELGRLETAPALVRRPVDLQDWSRRSCSRTTPRAVERQMDLGLEVEGPLPLVTGDADRLRQVFLNLLDNALKYARPGDHVRVALRREEAGVACAVCDTGTGIPAEHLPYIPRRFYRSRRALSRAAGWGWRWWTRSCAATTAAGPRKPHAGRDRHLRAFVLPVK